MVLAARSWSAETAKSPKEAFFLIAREGGGGAEEGSSGSGAMSYRGQVMSCMVDQEKNAWLYVRVLLNYEEAMQINLKIRTDFEPTYELAPLLTPPIWIRASCLSGCFYLKQCTKEDFKFQMANNLIPRENIFFLRISVDAILAKQKKNKTSSPHLKNK